MNDSPLKMNDMAIERERMIVLAGRYALGLLSEQEAAAVESQIETNPTLRSLVAEWRERLAELDDEIEPIQPSSDFWAAIVRKLRNSGGADPEV
jgi:anti-sigma-K factor RskA